jgi:hypothetical protein
LPASRAEATALLVRGIDEPRAADQDWRVARAWLMKELAGDGIA